MTIPDQYASIFFLFGFLLVLGHAVQRFNEPSFPNRDTLPRTLVPLRYLFLRPAYQKARLAYVFVALLMYILLLAPGQEIITALAGAGFEKFPAKAWALPVALIMTGLSAAPSSLKFLNVIEEQLRRWIHTWFLVPDGVKRMIGILEDADYEPPPDQLKAVASPLREQLRDDLKQPRNSLQYRWARAGMLMQSLRQMGAGASHPLKTASFEPFTEDLQEIRKWYKAVRQDISEVSRPISQDKEEELLKSVNDLLKRIYSYISWGIRNQADSQREIDETLKRLGFRIPLLGDRRLFDVVAPMIGIAALIAAVFSFAIDGVRSLSGVNVTLASTVVNALISTTTASSMYGCAVFIALRQRASHIEQKSWKHGSPRCLAPIALLAGLVTMAVIIVTTLVLRFPDMVQSLPELVKVIAGKRAEAAATWNFLPVKVGAAVPWFLAGATVSVILAYFLGGDVRRTNMRDRLHDALMLGVGLGLAAGTAQLLQTAFVDLLDPAEAIPHQYVLVEGFSGFLCGAVIGFMVPAACRANLITPRDPKVARALRNLLRQAEISLRDRAKAEDWVFTAHPELPDLPGISPAEAVQYEGLATGVQRLLDSDGTSESEENDLPSSQAHLPEVIETSEITLDPTAHVERTLAPLH
jgi:hypothetical protein